MNIVRGPEPPSNEYIVEYIEKILKNPKVLNERDGEEEEEKEFFSFSSSPSLSKT